MALKTQQIIRTTTGERRKDRASGFKHIGGQLQKRTTKLMDEHVPANLECSKKFQSVSTSLRKNISHRETGKRSLTVKRGPIMREKTNSPKIGLRYKETDPRIFIKHARSACAGGCWSNIGTHCKYDDEKQEKDGECFKVNYSYLDVRQVKKRQWKSTSQGAQRSMTQIRICASLCSVKNKITAHELDFRLLRDEMFLNVVNTKTESVSTFCSLKCECLSDLQEYKSVPMRCSSVFEASSDWACYHFKTEPNDGYNVEYNVDEKKHLSIKHYVEESRTSSRLSWMKQDVQYLERTTPNGRNRGYNSQKYNSDGRFLWKSNAEANTVARNKRKTMPESPQPRKFNTELYRNKPHGIKNTTSRNSNCLKDSSTSSNIRSKSLIRRRVKDENTLRTNNKSTKPIATGRKNNPILTSTNNHDNAKRTNVQGQKTRPVEKSADKRYPGNSYKSKLEPERKANLNSRETNSKLGASKPPYDPKRGRDTHSCISYRAYQVQNKPEKEVKGKYQQQSKGTKVQTQTNAQKADNKAKTYGKCFSSESRKICLQNTVSQKLKLCKYESEDGDVKQIRLQCFSMNQKRIQCNNKMNTTNDNNVEMEVNDARSVIPVSSRFCGFIQLNSEYTTEQQQQQQQQQQEQEKQQQEQQQNKQLQQTYHHHQQQQQQQQQQQLVGKEYKMIPRKPSEGDVIDVDLTVEDTSESTSKSSCEDTRVFTITVFTTGEVGKIMTPVSGDENKSSRPKYRITVCYADPNISSSESYDIEADIVSEETIFISSMEDHSSGKEDQNMNSKNGVNKADDTSISPSNIINVLADLGSIKCKEEKDQTHYRCVKPEQNIYIWQDALSQMNAGTGSFKRKQEEDDDLVQYVKREQNVSVWDDIEGNDKSLPTFKKIISLDYNASNEGDTYVDKEIPQNESELLQNFQYDHQRKSNEGKEISAFKNKRKSEMVSSESSKGNLSEQNESVSSLSISVSITDLNDASSKSEVCCTGNINIDKPRVELNEQIGDVAFAVTTSLLYPTSIIPRKESRLNLEKCPCDLSLKKELGSSSLSVKGEQVECSLSNEKEFSGKKCNSSRTEVRLSELLVITSHGDAPKNDQQRRISTESLSTRTFEMINSLGIELLSDSEISKGSDKPMHSTVPSSSSSSSSPSSSQVLDTKSVTHVKIADEVSISNLVSNMCPPRTDQCSNEAHFRKEICKECGGRQMSKSLLTHREKYKTTILYSSDHPYRKDISSFSSSVNGIDFLCSDNSNEIERSNSEVIIGSDFGVGASLSLLPERIYFAGAVYEKRTGGKRIYKKYIDENLNREMYGISTRPRHSKRNRYLYASDRYLLNRLRRHTSLPALRRVYISEAFAIAEAGPPANRKEKKQLNSSKKYSDNWTAKTPAEWNNEDGTAEHTEVSAVFKGDYKTELKPRKESVCNVKSGYETAAEPVMVIWPNPNTKPKLISAISNKNGELSMNGSPSYDQNHISCLTSIEQQGKKLSQNNNVHESEVSRRKRNCSYDSLFTRKLHETKREKCGYHGSSEKKGPINMQMNQTKMLNTHERKSELKLYNEDFAVQKNLISKRDVLNSSSDDHEIFQDAADTMEFDDNFQCICKHPKTIPIAVNNASNNTESDEIIIYFSTCCMHDNSQRNRMNGQANPNGEAYYAFSPSSTKQDPDERRLSFKNIRCLAKKKISRRQRDISEKFHSCTCRIRSLFSRTSSKIYESPMSSNDEDLFPVVHITK